MNTIWNLSRILVLLMAVYGCNNKPAQKITEISDSCLVIQLVDAFKNPQEVFLSSIVDSITFIRLETNNKCLLRGYPVFYFTHKYILTGSLIFNWEGKFLRKIGITGKGPCEDPNSYLKVKYYNGNFYSQGNKFIEYDSLGMCTGNEWQFFMHKKGEPLGSGFYFTDFEPISNKFAIYKYPDSIYWMNDKFIMTGEGARVIRSGEYQKECGSHFNPPKYFERYKDQTLFYNYYNDTIYRVETDKIIPKYILQFQKLKLPELFFEYSGSGWMDKAYQAWESGTSFKRLKYFRMSDGKQFITHYFESENFLFLIHRDVHFFATLRGVTPQPPHIAFYNKYTGTVISVKGTGFVDDILGFKSFIPLCGEFDEKLIMPVLPIDILRFYEKKKQNGEIVNNKLMNLVKQIKEDDNQVLFVVYLKKDWKNISNIH